MNYWKAVLDEVLNKDNPNFEFQYTTLKEAQKSLHDLNSEAKYTSNKHARRSYPLGPPYEAIYFTQREAECYYYFSQGDTIAACAKSMNLSPRTVEFYVRNMKLKLKLESKAEMIKCLACTDLAERVAFFAKEKT